ncbi:MAG: histidine--tRNA ligase [Crocinitomicaceae bacterium]|jgi:histidyl-tRNA synthetase|nr:histidine--tRNA ligase [Crocinitomicaceae bacterium]
MAQKTAIPKGTRDFLPMEVAKRTYIFETLKKNFKIFGFEPIETPSFELSSTLMGKYGEEGDRLIFRILNSGEKVKKADLQALEENNLPRFANSLSEKALRYDLTVPFARFVVQHQNDLTFPFKRYQIQPVWRADRPQHGRYQEFFQCDADVVGSDSLLHEVDLVQLFDRSLTDLDLPSFRILINNRKILSGIAEVCGEQDRIVDITVAIDKLDKIGEEGVVTELEGKGISAEAIAKIKPLFAMSGSNEEVLAVLTDYLKDSEIGLKGIEELKYVLIKTELLGLHRAIVIVDVTLARGLNYYTGAIFEVKADDVKMGSICGGGRYDDLTGLFGMKGMSGVGISFGADRIYDVMNELNLFPEEVLTGVELMFVNFGEETVDYVLPILHELRKLGIKSELYPSSAKMQKQMKYANDKNIQWVVLAGGDEMSKGEVQLKNMTTGDQVTVGKDELVKKIGG